MNKWPLAAALGSLLATVGIVAPEVAATQESAGVNCIISSVGTIAATGGSFDRRGDSGSEDLKESEVPKNEENSSRFQRIQGWSISDLVRSVFIAMIVAVVINLLMVGENRRRMKKYIWDRWGPIISEFEAPNRGRRPFIETYEDFFDALIGKLNEKTDMLSKRGVLYSILGDHHIKSLKIMVGSPISGHGSSWYGSQWKINDSNDPLKGSYPHICELIQALEKLVEKNEKLVEKDKFTRRIICIHPDKLKQNFIDRIKEWNPEIKQEYQRIANLAYEWYATHGFKLTYIDHVYTLIVIIEDICGRKEMITANTNVLFFEIGLHRRYRCPGFYTRKEDLISIYEKFFEDIWNYEEQKRRTITSTCGKSSSVKGILDN